MPEAFFNARADLHKARAVSAGTQPSARVHGVVIAAMREVGLDLHAATPRLLTPELAKGVSWLITMGCGDACGSPPYLQRAHRTLPPGPIRPSKRVPPLLPSVNGGAFEW